jgi:hypothetical protein
MVRLYEIVKTPRGSSTGKALLKHTIFSQSQTGETVPLNIESVEGDPTTSTPDPPNLNTVHTRRESFPISEIIFRKFATISKPFN